MLLVISFEKLEWGRAAPSFGSKSLFKVFFEWVPLSNILHIDS